MTWADLLENMVRQNNFTFPDLFSGEDKQEIVGKKVEIKAREAIAFEDSSSGIKSAVGAGVYTVAIATTHPEEDLLKAGAKMVIDDFSDPQLWAHLNGS